MYLYFALVLMLVSRSSVIRSEILFVNWPLMVKPVAEGSSKGVIAKSVCHSENEVRDVVRGAPATGLPVQRVHGLDQGRERRIAGASRQAAHRLHAWRAQGAGAGHRGIRAVRRPRHAWRFRYTRVAARSAQGSPCPDSRFRAGS